MTRSISFTALAVTLSLAATGCMTTQQIVRDDGVARIGEPTRAGSLIVRPTKVIEDSRCPINARCVWAGRVVVRAVVSYRDMNETIDLTLGEKTIVDGGELLFESLSPAKSTDMEIDRSDYRFRFTYDKWYLGLE